MDKLAVELLTLISLYACTDGGYTGCSLSLVSKRIREASRPVRFYSISLVTSPAQVEQFMDCLQKERARSPEMLPRVRHLILSLFGRGLEMTPSTNASRQPASRAEFLASLNRRTQHWRSAQDNLDEQYARTVPRLIRSVAPDLYTFALIQAQWRSSSIVRCSFPLLRELTLCGGDPSFLPFAFLPSDRPLYPSLRRLHHILAWIGRDVDFMQWAKHAPNVTHLRVSRLDHLPRITVDTLDQVISDSYRDYFPHLRRAMIEPHPAPPPCAQMSTAHLAFRDFLCYLDRLAERARVPVKVLPPLKVPPLPAGATPQQLCIMRVKKEWLERVVDGDGCWQEGLHGNSD
ncbi:hypothetical protein BV20DRAFT_941472 [Pilatotrama ljubarskyi]|nr:hypothetical protein BV20DRAFT_941472 [Pilatotrama ljubarskyi]